MASDRDDALLPYLKALLLLQLEALRNEEIFEAKPELLLDRAGIDKKEIAEMLGKTYEAVTKTITRAKSGAAE